MSPEHLFYGYIAGTFLFTVFFCSLVAYVVIHKRKQNALLRGKEILVLAHRNKLYETRLNEQERVLSQVSKELHDHFGQALNFVKMSVTVMGKYLDHSAPADLEAETHRMLDKVINGVHDISHSMNSEYIRKQGLEELLRVELNQLQELYDIDCLLTIADGLKLHPEQELLLYRVAQEAIHNVVKHASATVLRVVLEQAGTGFRMSISDNGQGFELNSETQNKGIGIQNMRERACGLQGRLEIASGPGAGTKVEVVVSGQL